ncbi:MAG: response regulator [Synechococcales cyanobacterium C42_A2020_086]|jgi:CheY-like chemotaxis protein|nr:response regulator [Synechococcales cyanobacterium M58_A2018_015]MBF2075245.1 response regulator [Synechococcales cyanobacterium C42_A2020_086]
MYHIAVVDDNEAWRLAVQYLLQQEGLQVSTFADPHSFFKLAEQFDLVLVDFSLPARNYQTWMDGAELIRKIKQQLDRPPLLILVSGFFTEKEREIARSLCPEADDYLSKSVAAQGLIQQVKRFLHLNSTHLSESSRHTDQHRSSRS